MAQKDIPDPSVKNAILAAKRIVRQHQNKGESEKEEDSSVAEEIYFTAEETLKLDGFLESEVDELRRVRLRLEREHENRKAFSEKTVATLTGKRKPGQQYAKDVLIQQTVEILPNGFVLPAGPEGLPKKRDDLIRFYARREAAETALRLVALALKEYAGYSEKQMQYFTQNLKEQYEKRLEEKAAEDLKE